ncbi:hypothetical protein GCM10028820_26510 [Tessaracoccus terricola]
MSDAKTAASPAAGGLALTPRVVRAVTWVGLSSAIIGLITGLAMLLQRRVVDCLDGTFFPNGTTDFRCFEHPLALEGAAVSALAISVGALMLLTSSAVTTSDIRAKAEPPQAATEGGRVLGHGG